MAFGDMDDRVHEPRITRRTHRLCSVPIGSTPPLWQYAIASGGGAPSPSGHGIVSGMRLEPVAPVSEGAKSALHADGSHR